MNNRVKTCIRSTENLRCVFMSVVYQNLRDKIRERKEPSDLGLSSTKSGIDSIKLVNIVPYLCVDVSAPGEE